MKIMANNIRAWSSGGGVQSIAGLVLSAQGAIDFPLHIFANVGDDSERKETLDYVHNVAMPYAEKHGIEFVELHFRFKSKKLISELGTDTETLYQRMMRTRKSIPIPIRRSGGFPMGRVCTIDFKVRVVADYIKDIIGESTAKAVCAIGFTIDEWVRLRKKNSSGFDFYTLEYPLYDLGLSRADCINIISDAGLPIPPKSSCWFCPHTKHLEWCKIANDNPELFKKACDLEKFLSQKAGEQLFLHKYLVPLDQAVRQMYFDIDQIEECTGFCFT